MPPGIYKNAVRFVKSLASGRMRANTAASLELVARRTIRKQKNIMNAIEEEVRRTGSRITRDGELIISGPRYGEYYQAQKKLREAEKLAAHYAHEKNRIPLRRKSSR